MINPCSTSTKSKKHMYFFKINQNLKQKFLSRLLGEKFRERANAKCTSLYSFVKPYQIPTVSM